MNNKLPKVFVNKIDKVLNVNQDYTRSTSSINLEIILDDKNKYLFMHKYLISLNDGKTIEDSILSKRGENILTLDNGLIKINSIKSIMEIKK